ncbi:hypothetical protein HHI36_005575 [Cryptolaemus montrouzieri]|uniref:Uncharacterized protein n=1 Tax=Cryptolaemus montrouzieri TaxID=559131 RepID=A0ABD2NUS8_9CUCU
MDTQYSTSPSIVAKEPFCTDENPTSHKENFYFEGTVMIVLKTQILKLTVDIGVCPQAVGLASRLKESLLNRIHKDYRKRRMNPNLTAIGPYLLIPLHRQTVVAEAIVIVKAVLVAATAAAMPFLSLSHLKVTVVLMT